MTDSVDERTRALERYAAGVLQFDAVLGLVAAHATTSLGRRALSDLSPRGDHEARAALARCHEITDCLARQDEPGMAGVTDPFPDGIEGRLDEDRIAAIRDFLDANLRLKRWAVAREEELPETAALMAASRAMLLVFDSWMTVPMITRFTSAKLTYAT